MTELILGWTIPLNTNNLVTFWLHNYIKKHIKTIKDTEDDAQNVASEFATFTSGSPEVSASPRRGGKETEHKCLATII